MQLNAPVHPSSPLQPRHVIRVCTLYAIRPLRCYRPLTDGNAFSTILFATNSFPPISLSTLPNSFLFTLYSVVWNKKCSCAGKSDGNVTADFAIRGESNTAP